MRIKKLILNNFQGIKKLELDFDGKSCSIYGDNATGKTTIFNAFTWLLFDKASTGAKNFSPKTTDGDGFKHGLTHSSEAICQMESGRTVSFKKEFKEVYKKTRGSAVEEFSGHTTDYFIDGVPVQQKEFNETIKNYFGDPEQLKMLTMPHYFSEDMRWEDRRKLLLEICGDVSDEDVIDSNEELKDLNDFLIVPGTENQKYTVDEYKKIASSRMTKINKEIESIPVRINEASLAIPNVDGISLKDVESRIKRYEKTKEELEKEKQQILSGDTGSEKIRKQIAELQTEFEEERAKYTKEAYAVNDKLKEKVNELQEGYNLIKREQFDVKDLITAKEHELEKLEKKRSELTEEYKKVFALKWDESEESCPMCKQSLPAEQIQEEKEKFNLNKSKRLEEINKKGKSEASKEIIAQLKEELKELENKKVDCQARLEKQEAMRKDLESQIKDVTPFEKTDKAKEMTEKIEKLKEQEQKGISDVTFLTAGVTKKILLNQEKIKEQEEIRAKFATIEIQKKRIAELMEEESTLSKEYENLKKGMYLCELMIKTKVSMLDEEINARFVNVRFRLFQEQVNGGIKEDCEVLVPSENGDLVPYAFANNAGRINAGLEIIDTLGAHWGKSMPVFVDNAESVTKLVKTDAQVIRLVVSEADKKLRLKKGE